MELKVREALRLKVCRMLKLLSKQLQRRSNSKVAECLLNYNSEKLM